MEGSAVYWLKGNVRIRITGGFCERFLNLCAYHGMKLWDLRSLQNENGYEVMMSVTDFRQIRPLAHKCRVRVHITEKKGVPFFINYCRKRKAMVLAAGSAAVLLFVLSLFVWDIRIEGNMGVTDDAIRRYLLENQISQGVRRAAVDCKALAAGLRRQFPQLAWVSVKLEGTRIQISLKENYDPGDLPDLETPADLVSDVEGIVTEMVTRTGTPVIKVGDELHKGDVLVEGRVEIRDDAGELTGCQYVKADADIYVKTAISYEDRVAYRHEDKVYTGRKVSRTLLKYGAFSAGLPFGKVNYPLYDTVTEQKQLSLGKNFPLPFFYSKITVREYENAEKIRTPAQAQKILEQRLANFLEKIQEKGVQISANNVKIEKVDFGCTAKGSIFCVKKTGVCTPRTTNDLEKEGFSKE